MPFERQSVAEPLRISLEHSDTDNDLASEKVTLFLGRNISLTTMLSEAACRLMELLTCRSI
jgi:hypothetical protein